MSQPIEAYLKGLRSRQQRFSKDQPLFHRGDGVSEMYLVRSGTIHLVRYQRDGSALVLQRAGPGSILAEASLYSTTYHCDAVTSDDADTTVYAKTAVKKLLAGSPEFSSVWAGYLARELQASRLRSEMLALKTVAERLDAWILWNGAKTPPKGQWKLIASQIGVSPEALYREIAKRRG